MQGASEHTQLDLGVLSQQDVLAFDVTVDDVVGMQVGQTLNQEIIHKTTHPRIQSQVTKKNKQLDSR